MGRRTVKGSRSCAVNYRATVCMHATPRVLPFMGTLQPQSNRQLYSNTVIGTLAVDRWAVTFGSCYIW